MEIHRDQFFGLPPTRTADAQVIFLPAPYEGTVTYGGGTAQAPFRILETSYQLETFDEETHVDFETAPRIHVARPAFPHEYEKPEPDLERLAGIVRELPRDRFLLSVGGEHLVTYGIVRGLYSDEELKNLTIVQIDAHCDLVDELEGRRWSHGTVMRRLLDHGCSFIQIGIRSLSKEEHELVDGEPRVQVFYAHRLAQQWEELLVRLESLAGNVYLSFDVDGMDPSVIWSTGTPQPQGLTWSQAMEILRTLFLRSRATFRGADLVEYIPDPSPPGCDTTACKLISRLLAYWWTGR